MDAPSQARRDPRKVGGVRPFVLAGGLALMWFVEMQAGGMATDAPAWGVALVVGGRLAADFIGAWAVVSVLRLVLALARFALAYWRARSALGA